MSKIKTSITVIVIWLSMGLYTAFVAMCYFNWFVAHVLNANNVSYLEMLGIVWLFGLFRAPDKSEENNNRIDYDKHSKVFWEKTFIIVFERVVNNTLLLAIGFGLHIIINNMKYGKYLI